jgi:hypothetical protein
VFCFDPRSHIEPLAKQSFPPTIPPKHFYGVSNTEFDGARCLDELVSQVMFLAKFSLPLS